MNEKTIENYFIWAVASMGGRTYKFRSVSQRGVSDRIACLLDGSTWFVELKAPNGRLSELQKIFANEMKLLNQNYRVFNSIEEIDEWKLHNSK